MHVWEITMIITIKMKQPRYSAMLAPCIWTSTLKFSSRLDKLSSSSKWGFRQIGQVSWSDWSLRVLKCLKRHLKWNVCWHDVLHKSSSSVNFKSSRQMAQGSWLSLPSGWGVVCSSRLLRTSGILATLSSQAADELPLGVHSIPWVDDA